MGNEVVYIVDAMFGIHCIGLYESSVSIIALFHVKHIVVFHGSGIAGALFKRIDIAMIAVVDVALERVLHASDGQCSVEQRDGRVTVHQLWQHLVGGIYHMVDGVYHAVFNRVVVYDELRLLVHIICNVNLAVVGFY